MRTNAAGQGIIKDDEGLELTAYPDPGTKDNPNPAIRGKPWTIGWGSTRGVVEGLVITEAQAQVRFQEDVEAVESLLNDATSSCFLTENQFSALVSFCFNIGFGRKATDTDPGKDGFATLRNGEPSSLLRWIRSGDFENAADEFPKWKGNNLATENGLLQRRLLEMDLFLKPDAPTPAMGGES